MKMKRSRLFGLSFALVLGILGFGTWMLTRPASPVTEDNFKQIHAGMTQAEVEAILGKPDDFDESVKMSNEKVQEHLQNKRMINMRMVQVGKEDTEPSSKALWTNGETQIVVSFSDQKKVNSAELLTIPNLTMIERIRSWLGL
jgi:hypothetical protein